MAKKATNELQALADEELQNQLEESVEAYAKMRYEHQVTPMERPGELKIARRNIARMHTEVRRRELEAAGEEVHAKRDRIRNRRRNAKK
ncbi:MAG: 50S ribosomal protein L29 [Bacteroidota bacterium]